MTHGISENWSAFQAKPAFGCWHRNQRHSRLRLELAQANFDGYLQLATRSNTSSSRVGNGASLLDCLQSQDFWTLKARQSFSIENMNRFVFNLNISTQEYLPYYRGVVNKVVATCNDGTTVQFPAGLLTPFVTNGGIRGAFVLTCNEDGKGAQLRRR